MPSWGSRTRRMIGAPLRRCHRMCALSMRPGKVLDLMAALNESVQQAKASRGEDADVHEMPKKKTTKKQSAKKAAAKKTTKMTPGRRPRSA